NHKPVVRITAFSRQRDLPLRLGLVIDTSGSVNPRFHFEQDAATQFLKHIVQRPSDRAFVLGFADHTSLTQDYSNDAEQLAQGVATLRNGGGTAFFDAVDSACEKLAAPGNDEFAA